MPTAWARIGRSWKPFRICKGKAAVTGLDRAASLPDGRAGRPKPIGLSAVFRHLARRPVVALSWVIVLAVMLVSLLAPWLAPFDPTDQATTDRMLPMGSDAFAMGTDQFGRDQLSRLLWGGRPLIVISLVSVAIAIAAGFVIGLCAGYLRGWIDMVLMRVMDVILSFPLILFAIVIVAALGPNLINVIIAIALSQIPVFARLVRALTVGETAKEYVLAGKAVGFSTPRIMLSEIAPNLVGPVIVQGTSVIAVAALYSAALSYLGLGIQPPEPDWGYMVKEGQQLLFFAPSLALVPGICIAVFVTAWNFIGDDLRDLFAAGGETMP